MIGTFLHYSFFLFIHIRYFNKFRNTCWIRDSVFVTIFLDYPLFRGFLYSYYSTSSTHGGTHFSEHFFPDLARVSGRTGGRSVTLPFWGNACPWLASRFPVNKSRITAPCCSSSECQTTDCDRGVGGRQASHFTCS